MMGTILLSKKHTLLFLLLFPGCTPGGMITSQIIPEGNLKITEVSSANRTLLFDNDGKSPDWIEVGNIGEETISLEGFSLSNSWERPQKFIFPRYLLSPGEYIIVFASGKETQSSLEFHAPFRLKKNGDQLFLFSPTGAAIDYMKLPQLKGDMVYGIPAAASDQKVILAMATPGRANHIYPAGNEAPLTTPHPSHATGFYDKSFQLDLNPEKRNIAIYYSLDCSEPALNSRLYTEPLTMTPALADENPRLSASDEFFSIPSFVENSVGRERAADKGVVLRYRAFKEGVPPGAIRTLVFWFSDPPPGDAPVVSLVTEHAHLTDPKRGIYVTGEVHEKWLRNHTYDALEGNWPANYNRRGAAWEVMADFELLEAKDGGGVAAPVRLKVHGGWSRDKLHKSLRVKFYLRGDDFAGLNYPIFPGLNALDGSDRPTRFYRSLIFRNFGNDRSYTLFRDAFISTLFGEAGLSISAHRPAHLYLNGEYWGPINIREHFNAGYFYRHYGVPLGTESFAVMQQYSDRTETKTGSEELGWNHWQFISSLLPVEKVTSDDRLLTIEEAVDIDDYLNYFICQLYVGNRDWPGNNNRFWQAGPYPHNAETPAAQHTDGRYRQLVFDTEFSFGIYHSKEEGYKEDSVALATAVDGPEWPNPEGSTRLFRTLMNHPATRAAYLQRYFDLTNTIFSASHVIEVIDRFAAEYEPFAEMVRQRWDDGGGWYATGWWEEVENLRYFANHRLAVLDAYTNREFSFGSLHTFTIDSGGVPLVLNGLPVFGEIMKGRYHDGAQVTVRSRDNKPVDFLISGVVYANQLAVTFTVDRDTFIQVKPLATP